MTRLFGTDGVRGIVGKDMTHEVAMRLGLALGTHLRLGSTVAVGRDARLSGPMLASAVVAGLLATGVNVVRLGIATTPAIQFHAAQHEEIDAAVIVTASHNPGQWNGLKFIAGDGTEASREDEERVEKLYDSQKFRLASWKDVGRLSHTDACNDAYVKAVTAKFKVAAAKRRKLRVVVDPAGGPGTLVTPRFLQSIGCEAILLHGELDGTFAGRSPEPTEDNLGKLKARVKETKADLGIAHDGDADRAIFVDETGAFVPGDQSFALIAEHLVKKNKGGVVCTPVSTGSVVEEVVTRAGGTIVYTAVGSPIVGRRMRKERAVFGGEENGGLIFPDHQYCRDALMSVAVMLELLFTTGKRLGELRAALPKFHVSKQKFECANEAKAHLARALRDWTKSKYPTAKIDETDGFKVYFDDGWVLARASGTEPIYRVYAESRSEARSAALAKEFVEQSKALLKSQDLKPRAAVP
ncbi:MAG TPA: phosphoglucosamine mutase [Candidatus Thermoplasmatota archaeon]|nr:phosphoglucosamine mutase [Candidatus Thermoplasmatota archaeon]